MNKNLLKIIFFVILVFVHSMANAEWINFSSDKKQHPDINVSGSIGQNTIDVTLSGFNKNRIKSIPGNYYSISCPELTSILEAGAPELPKIALSLIIPDQGQMNISTQIESFVDIPNIAIAPSKGNLYRNINPNEVPYSFGSAYNKDIFYPGMLASVRDPFILRDFRGQTVLIYPFQYNPVTKVLRVITKMKVSFTNNQNQDGINVFHRPATLISIDREFLNIYQSIFKNGYQAVNYLPLSEDGEMLILSDGSFMQAMQPFVDWKIKKGIPVTMIDVSTAGTTAQQIKSYIQNYYLNHNLKYVLLVGDAQQIPSPVASGGASDPSYGYLAGNDSYSEVFVGRFSAQTIADVQTLVQRTLEYEMNPLTVNGWHGRGVCIGSDQGPGDDNEMDYEHERNIRAKELGFTYTDVAELYDGSQGLNDLPGNPSPASLISELNQGASIVTYTGHGSTTSFGTTGFSNTSVASLTNNNKLPFVWSVACVNGDFVQSTCLAEALTRAQYNGQPSGAVATFMSSINQSWSPPMDAQDEMVDLLVGTYGSNCKRTFGGLSVNGCMHMNDQYGSAGFEMTDTWHCFGDPSLSVRTASPYNITATHNPILMIGANQLTINCNTDSAIACISSNGQIVCTGMVIGGVVNLTFPALTTLDTLYLTITAFNGYPYIVAIPVITANGPFISTTANQIIDVVGNGNQQADYGEQIQVDLTLHNFGNADAQNVNISVSTTSPFVTLNTASSNAGTIQTGSSVNVAHAFSYSVAGLIPDHATALFNLNLSDQSGNNWTTTISHLLKAPLLQVYSLTINDAGGNGNGVLEPGENADIIIRTNNKGHSNSPLCLATLTTTSPYLTIQNGSYQVGSIAALSNADAIFQVSLASNIQVGTVYDLHFEINGSPYNDSITYHLMSGEILEDFETGNFNKYPWIVGNQNPWTISSSNIFQGAFAALSAPIGDGDTSSLSININVIQNDSISFYALISTEANWDFLNFYIDGTLVDNYSGVYAWAYHSYPLTAGPHTLTWSYIKDEVCCTGGLDLVMLDNIKFPPSTLITAIHDADPASSVIVYPNPASDELVVPMLTNTSYEIQLYAADGKLVYHTRSEGAATHKIDMRGLSSGLYNIIVKHDNSVQSSKIFKR
jgi:hypothetical protein